MRKNNWEPVSFKQKWTTRWSLLKTLNHIIRKRHSLTLTMRMLWRHYSYQNAVFVTNNWLNLHKLTQDHTEKFTSHTLMLKRMNGLYIRQYTTDSLIGEIEVLKLNGKVGICHNFTKNQAAISTDKETNTKTGR